jgi:hypothetical protein
MAAPSCRHRASPEELAAALAQLSALCPPDTSKASAH